MKIKPMLGQYELPGIQKIGTVEERSLVEVDIPGLRGNYHQDHGSKPVTLKIEGTLYGDDNRDAFLEAIREIHHSGEPQDFVADITTATEIEQMVIEKFTATEVAGTADSFTYHLTLKQHVEPPPAPAENPLDDAIDAEADELMDIMDIPEALSAPNFGNPTPPLQGTIDELKNTMGELANLESTLNTLFGE